MALSYLVVDEKFQSLKGILVDFQLKMYLLLADTWLFQSLKGILVDFQSTAPSNVLADVASFNP